MQDACRHSDLAALSILYPAPVDRSGPQARPHSGGTCDKMVGIALHQATLQCCDHKAFEALFCSGYSKPSNGLRTHDKYIGAGTCSVVSQNSFPEDGYSLLSPYETEHRNANNGTP